jgi:hypothetical protein
MIEQRAQFRIVLLVVDDEADVDRNLRSIVIDGHGMAVAAGTKLAVIDRDCVASREGPGRGIAGNAGSDHRDTHLTCLPLLGQGRYGTASAGVSGVAMAREEWKTASSST